MIIHTWSIFICFDTIISDYRLSPHLATLTHPKKVPENCVLEPKGQFHITNMLLTKVMIRVDSIHNVARGTDTFWEVIPWRRRYVPSYPDLQRL